MLSRSNGCLRQTPEVEPIRVRFDLMVGEALPFCVNMMVVDDTIILLLPDPPSTMEH